MPKLKSYTFQTLWKVGNDIKRKNLRIRGKTNSAQLITWYAQQGISHLTLASLVE